MKFLPILCNIFVLCCVELSFTSRPWRKINRLRRRPYVFWTTSQRKSSQFSVTESWSSYDKKDAKKWNNSEERPLLHSLKLLYSQVNRPDTKGTDGEKDSFVRDDLRLYQFTVNMLDYDASRRSEEHHDINIYDYF